jgi:hypothetical protein
MSGRKRVLPTQRSILVTDISRLYTIGQAGEPAGATPAGGWVSWRLYLCVFVTGVGMRPGGVELPTQLEEEARWDERLRKVAKQKPEPAPERPKGLPAPSQGSS